MISDTVTIIELLWTLAGAFGFLVCIFNFIEAAKDYYALQESGRNGALAEVARTSGKGETARLLGHASVATIGALAMQQPSPAGPWPTTPLGIAITLGLFIAVGVLLYESILSRRSRERLKREIAQMLITTEAE